MSSRLFQEIREKRGLAYSVYSFSSAFNDGGLFGLYAGTGEEQLNELVTAVSGELLRIAEQQITEDELTRSRAQIKAGVLMSLESTSSRAERIARHLMVYGRIMPVNEMSQHIDAVSADDVRRVAGRLLQSPPTIAVLGPVGGLADYTSLQAALGV